MAHLPRRDFLMRAKDYKPDKHSVGGYYLSEKLDGVRVFWDGGLSRDVPTENVPYANAVDPKTGEVRKNIKPVATGLWSQYGNPVIAPDWFLNQLPCVPLDGAIWAGRGNKKHCIEICRGSRIKKGWEKAEFAVFSCPALDVIFSDGLVINPRTQFNILYANFMVWMRKLNKGFLKDFHFLIAGGDPISFNQELTFLNEMIPSDGVVYLHYQKKLPAGVVQAESLVEEETEKILRLGGQGVMLRAALNPWIPKRTETLVKYTP